MKLIYLGLELDAEQDHELFASNEFGFKVLCEKSDSFSIFAYFNCTEVHYKFESMDGSKDKIAFESDIHKTGCWHNISDFESVKIELSTKQHEDFYHQSNEIF